jgi:hypothetical protein
MQAHGWLPPSDPTNGQIKCTVKLQRQSIINHRKFLMAAGLTHETQAKGEKVQLYIHPQLLVENPVEAQKRQWEKISGKPYKSLFLAYDVQNLAPFHAKKDNVNINSGVESVKTPLSTGLIAGNELAGNGEEGILEKKFEQTPSPTTPSAGNGSAHQGGAGARSSLPEEKLKAYIENFWWVAQRLLYPKVTFSAGQHSLALSMIRKHVYYQGNKPWDDKMWQAQHQYNLARLQLVNRYLSRPDPGGKERFVPMPHVYFDSNNSCGFAGTKEWYLKEQTVRNQVRKQLIYEKSLRTVFEGAPSTRKPRSSYEIWLIEKNRVAKLGDQDLLKAFLSSTQHFQASHP